MPFLIRDLIGDRPEPTSVRPDATLNEALETMIEHDYSQLPVVDDQKRPLGLVTGDSILRTLKHFDAKLDDVKVMHARIDVDTCREEDNLFELLNDLLEASAILVVDGERRLKGIITSYDTTLFFRRRAEDMMHIEDIETTLRDHITAAFADANTELIGVIAQVSDQRAKTYKKAQKFLRSYLGQKGHPTKDIDDALFEKAFNSSFELPTNGQPKQLEELTLNQQIDVLLHEARWSILSPNFNLDSASVRILLGKVRDARNKLAHFRGEITAIERNQIRFCVDWLARIPLPAFETDGSATEEAIETGPNNSGEDNEATKDIADATTVLPVAEVLEPDDSRYAPLALHLQSQHSKRNRLELTFAAIESIIGDTLPSSARKHRAWWSNDTSQHPHAQQWLDIGWRMANVSLSGERVLFQRIVDREHAYIEFFSRLFNELRAKATFSVNTAFPDGTNWHTVVGFPQQPYPVGYLTYSFARHSRFRVEFYIDTGDQVRNKRVFDALHMRKEAIEAALGEQVSWERIDDKRASRIALYQQGKIIDLPQNLAELRAWAVPAMIRFHDVLQPFATEAVESIAR